MEELSEKKQRNIVIAIITLNIMLRIVVMVAVLSAESLKS